MRSVCYFGAFDPQYPRNQIIRHGLATQNINSMQINVPRTLRTWQKVPRLASQFFRTSNHCDALLLAEFGQSLALQAWVLSRLRRIPLIVDFFTSIYDSAVHDRQVVGPRSLQAKRFRMIDKLALQLADVVLVDTQANANYIVRNFSAQRRKITVVRVGAYTQWFHPQVEPVTDHQKSLLVQFVGTYIPLHGIQTVLEAAKLLTTRIDLRFELIGRGQTYAQMQSLANELNLSNVTFSEPVAPSILPSHIAAADISLGIFGTTDKAQRVIPNKVYQSLAMRNPVVSADTPALREAFQPGKHLLAVPVANPKALAAAIIQLADDPSLRESLAQTGYERILEEYTPETLGQQVVGVLDRLMVKHK